MSDACCNNGSRRDRDDGRAGGNGDRLSGPIARPEARHHPDALLAAARAGDRSSLGTLLQQYRSYLELLAKTQLEAPLQRRIDPSDLVQETFARACRHFSQFRGTGEHELIAWLRKIMIRTVMHTVEHEVQAGKRNVRREVSLQRYLDQADRSWADLGAVLASPTSSPSDQLNRREQSVLLADQLGRLPPHYRDVIVWRHLQGVSFDEIARRLDRSPSAVRALWLRALNRLRSLNAPETTE